MNLSEVARIISGMPYGNLAFQIKEILPPADAKRADLTFLFELKTKTMAGAVIAEQKLPKKNGIVVKDCKKAMYLLLKNLSASTKNWQVSPLAVIGKDVLLPKRCIIEPHAIIKDNVKIGEGTYIGANSYIDDGVEIGSYCEISPHVVVYRKTTLGNFVIINPNSVVGKEGFGFLKIKRYERLKHIGGVIIEDYVEIGAGVTIDRGTIGWTIIGKGTKIDNLVHIGHNVRIGKNCLIMGQAGIAGSTQIGNNVILCGQVGISDHLKIGDNAIVYAKSGVFKSLQGNKKYSGIPAREHQVVLKALARLYETIKKERKLNSF